MRDFMAFTDLLREQGCVVFTDEPLKNHCSFRIGGKADYLLIPTSEAALLFALRQLREEGIPHLLLGNGSNVLFADEGFRGAVVKLAGGLTALREKNGLVYCEAGVILSRLCQWALERSLSGLEFAFGIPGSVGGAVYMNAGAYGGEMKDVVVRVRYLTPGGAIREVPVQEMSFGYRHTAFMSNGGYILGAYFRLPAGDKETIAARMTELLNKRKASQPLEFPSAGSTFKRPSNGYAAAHIEECGLKGFRIGGAQVSRKHAGFVINTGDATCADVRALMAHIQKTVLEQHGVLLEPEVCLLA